MSKKLLLLLGVIVLGALLVTWWYSHALSFHVSAFDKRVQFEIEPGQGAGLIGGRLEARGLISSSLAFRIYVWQHENAKEFKAGRFVLKENMAMPEIVKTLTTESGEAWATILEGWRATEIAAYLDKENLADREAVMGCVKKCQFNFDFLKEKPSDADLEGFLFPDTYIVSSQSEVHDILEKMLMNFDKKFTAQMRTDTEKRGRSMYDIVTMASLIEREVKTETDRKLVSGILWKRLEEGMPLGVDATSLYLKSSWKDPLTIQDLNLDSPYNTRKSAGLPPTPICNPSLSSLQAAVYPTASPYYFYLSDGEGTVHYAKTLEEHNVNVGKYLN